MRKKLHKLGHGHDRKIMVPIAETMQCKSIFLKVKGWSGLWKVTSHDVVILPQAHSSLKNKSDGLRISYIFKGGR